MRTMTAILTGTGQVRRYMIKIETKRLLLYPISDEEMQKVIDDEKDPEMLKYLAKVVEI